MKDNVLNKEFSKADVQRLRNIVTKKYGDSTKSQVGYSKEKKFYSEGDVWEEDGKKWTIKNGIKQNITKLDLAKKLYLMPLLCPSCSKPMKTHTDKPFFQIHNKCLDCVVMFETKLRKEGKWDEYEKTIHNQEIDHLITEFKVWAEDELKESNSSYISEQGEMQHWAGGNKELLKSKTQETIDYLETLKK